MKPTLILTCGLALLAACSSEDSSSVPPASSAPPTAEAWKASARAAASTIDSTWMASRLSVLAADDMEGRDNLTRGGAKARAWLEGQMTDIGLEPMGTDRFEQAFAQGINLVGRIAGNDPALADEYVLVSGHYDTWASWARRTVNALRASWRRAI